MSDTADRWTVLSEAFEIIDGISIYSDPSAPVPTYKSAGMNPVSDDVWNNGYAPPLTPGATDLKRQSIPQFPQGPHLHKQGMSCTQVTRFAPARRKAQTGRNSITVAYHLQTLQPSGR